MLGKRIVSPVAEFCLATFFYNKVGYAPMFSVEKVQIGSGCFSLESKSANIVLEPLRIASKESATQQVVVAS